MNILAINTTTKKAEIVCGSEIEHQSAFMDSTFSEHIMGTIQNVLKAQNNTLDDIDALGIVTGPGSFTGIRIGMAVVTGIICGTNKKCVAVNSFELISYNISSSDYIAIIDSRNIESYYAIFRSNKVEEMGHGTLDQIKKFADEKGLQIYFSSTEKAIFNDSKLIAVDINENTLFDLILQKAGKGQFTEINSLCPIYIKLSQAEIGLEQKMKENLSFRDAEVNDVEALSVVDEQCFEMGTERYDKISFNEELNEKSKHYIVALYGKLVIGYVGLEALGDDLNLLKIGVLQQ